mmetsp:Transcript_27701/g.71107  ORF Transcript_27701/g.71107 Transcript_27701/m.71107 type:complete len:260 (-) Transcript_27701:487-1266(-)
MELVIVLHPELREFPGVIPAEELLLRHRARLPACKLLGAPTLLHLGEVFLAGLEQDDAGIDAKYAVAVPIEKCLLWVHHTCKDVAVAAKYSRGRAEGEDLIEVPTRQEIAVQEADLFVLLQLDHPQLVEGPREARPAFRHQQLRHGDILDALDRPEKPQQGRHRLREDVAGGQQHPIDVVHLVLLQLVPQYQGIHQVARDLFARPEDRHPRVLGVGAGVTIRPDVAARFPPHPLQLPLAAGRVVELALAVMTTPLMTTS